MPSTVIHACFELIKRENFGQENFGESPVIRQNFLPPKFCIIQYICDTITVMITKLEYMCYNY